MTQNNEREELIQLLNEMSEFCMMICNSNPDKKIKGIIESKAFFIGHHPFVLNPESISQNEQQEPFAYTDLDEDFMTKFAHSQYEKMGLHITCTTPLYTSPPKQMPEGWISLKDTLDSKVIKWGWYVDGENCNEPIFKIDAYGHSAKIYKAHDNQLWSAIVDGSGHRGLLNEAEAKSYVEDVIKSKLYDQAKSADKLRNIIELNAAPTTSLTSETNTEVGE